MRGEECDIVGDRLFDAQRFDGKVAKASPGKLRALPGDGGKIGRGRKQLLHNRFAPFIDKMKSGLFFASGRERGAVGDAASLLNPARGHPPACRSGAEGEGGIAESAIRLAIVTQ